MARLSLVDHVHMEVVTSSSNLQIGDSRNIHLRSRALAVQKEWTDFQGSEGDLAPFYLFRQTIPQPAFYESLQFNQVHRVPIIKVGVVRIISAAASSLVHIGSTEEITAESRVKHFRHYKNVPPGYKTRPELMILTPPGGGGATAPIAPITPSLPSLGGLREG